MADTDACVGLNISHNHILIELGDYALNQMESASIAVSTA
jgi:hypothetical protein